MKNTEEHLSPFINRKAIIRTNNGHHLGIDFRFTRHIQSDEYELRCQKESYQL